MKPLGGYAGYNAEWRELAEVVSRVNEIADRFFLLSLFFYKNFLFHHLSRISSHYSRTLRHLDLFLITLSPLEYGYKHKTKIIIIRTKKEKNGKVIHTHTHTHTHENT